MFWFLFRFNAILIAAAIIPAVFLLVRTYRADKLEKEPPQLLLSLVLYGILATIFASLAEALGSLILKALPLSETARNAVMYFGVVALAEEGFKYFLMKRKTWNSPSFNCQFDGVVYAVFTSLGFALWENLTYVFRFGFGTAIIRAVTAVPGHACFGVFMGVFYGVAKGWSVAGDENRSGRFRILSVLVPVLLHGAYDFIATMSAAYSTLIFVLFVAALFIAAFRVIRRASANDRYFAGYAGGSRW